MNRSDWHSRPGRSSSFIAKSTRFAIYHRDNFRCVYCGKRDDPPAYDGEGLTLDHLIPRDHGGNHKPANLVTACVSCNSSRQHKKHRKPTLQRLQRLASKPLNREVGKILAELQKQCSRHRLLNPLTTVEVGRARFDEAGNPIDVRELHDGRTRKDLGPLIRAARRRSTK
jgi:5-methylcytosine-specific restriction endonuclease McrA